MGRASPGKFCLLCLSFNFCDICQAISERFNCDDFSLFSNMEVVDNLLKHFTRIFFSESKDGIVMQQQKITKFKARLVYISFSRKRDVNMPVASGIIHLNT